MADRLDVSVADELDDVDRASIADLLSQLSSTAVYDPERLEALLAAPDVQLFVARADGVDVGMATLVTFPLVTGWRGIVEDVAVDDAARGQGIARLLLQAITAEAARRRLRGDLTSRPSRESALRLYESVGFERRGTNVLRYVPRVE